MIKESAGEANDQRSNFTTELIGSYRSYTQPGRFFNMFSNKNILYILCLEFQIRAQDWDTNGRNSVINGVGTYGTFSSLQEQMRILKRTYDYGSFLNRRDCQKVRNFFTHFCSGFRHVNENLWCERISIEPIRLFHNDIPRGKGYAFYLRDVNGNLQVHHFCVERHNNVPPEHYCSSNSYAI